MNGETHLSMGAGHPPPSKVLSQSIFICVPSSCVDKSVRGNKSLGSGSKAIDKFLAGIK